ncbi:MAG: DUF2442 domain-containing protein [Candidatus Ozemobacteraceae bacterium]
MDKQEQNFETRYLEALKSGKEAEEVEPRAVSAKYDAKSKRLVINLRSGVTFLLPIKLIEGMDSATGRELSAVEILGNGAALHWDSLDVDLSVPQLLMGVFGTKAWMSLVLSEIGKVGGSQKSPVKAKSSRKNGKMGGRPAKQKAA